MSNDYDRVSHVGDRRQLDARIDELTSGATRSTSTTATR